MTPSDFCPPSGEALPNCSATNGQLPSRGEKNGQWSMVNGQFIKQVIQVSGVNEVKEVKEVKGRYLGMRFAFSPVFGYKSYCPFSAH